MTFTIDQFENTLIIKPSGNLLGEVLSRKFDTILSERFNENELSSNIAIDLSEAEYINSTGIGSIINALNEVKNRGGRVVIISPSKHAQKMLSITKLDAIFDIKASKEEALKAFS